MVKEKKLSAAAVIEEIVDVVGISDMEGRITQINKAVEAWGYKKEELIGKPVVGVIAKHSLPKLIGEIKKTLETGGMRNLELVGLKKDGSEFPVLVNVSLMEDADGKPTGRIFTLRDITELKRAEEERVRAAAGRARAEEMEKKVQKMRLIYEGSRKMALTLEPDEIYNLALELACAAMEADGGSVMAFDEKTSELVVKVASGSQKEIAIGKRLKLGERFAGHAAQMKRALFMHEVEDEPWFKSLKKFEEIKSGMSIPLLVKDKLVGVINLKRTQRDEKFAKSDVGLVSILADYVASIIERKRAEEALRESEERLHTVVTGASIILFALDQNGVFTLSDGKGLDALGLKPGQVVGQSVFDVYRDVPKILEANRRALTGEVFTSIVEVAGLVFETRYSPLRDENGRVAGVIGVSTDITERKRAEEELKARVKELEEFHEVVVGRELKMKQMETELVRLRAKLGEK